MTIDPAVPVQLGFYRGSGTFFDRIVRWATRSEFSHVELVFPSSVPGKSIIVSSSPRDGGVRSKTLALDAEKWQIVDIHPAVDADQAWQFYAARAGQPYDFVGIFLSHVLPIRRHAAGRYFCSEFCARALGLPSPHSYSPQGLLEAVTMRSEAFEAGKLAA